MFDLSNKVALVTGASGGIGGAIARTFYQRGCKVILSGRRMEALQELSKDWDSHKVHHITTNLEAWQNLRDLVTESESALGPIDILVNNAGVTRDKLLMMMKDADWETVLATNLSATFSLSRGVIRGMIKRRKGRVIGISSVVGVSGNAGQSNYAASKAGMIGFYKSLAQEVASRNVCVNCIAPGFIQTAMTDQLQEDQRQQILQRIPMGRFGQAEDIANTALFLASDEASYVTGQTLHVNGGMLMPS